MTMHEPCGLDESVLLEYILGDASGAVRAAIERSPACVAAVEQLRADLLPAMQQLYRSACPAPEALVAYHARQLRDSTQHLLIHHHLRDCPLCQEEIQLLVAIDAVPLAPVGRGRRVVEAVLQSPFRLAEAVRGHVLHYQTPRLAINLSMRTTAKHGQHWTVRGQARTLDGVTAEVIEMVVAYQLDPTTGGVHDGVVEPQGSFVFRALPTGVYRLSILTHDEEITIAPVSVGDDV